jgi:hypothetical protein
VASTALPAEVKTTSVLRRVPPVDAPRRVAAPGLEGCVGAFRLTADSPTVIVEAASGRPMTLIPGDLFLATPGYRESTRVAVGGIPKHGLAPGKTYSLLSESGVVGDLIGGTPQARTFLGQARYLGAVAGRDGRVMTIGQFAVPAIHQRPDHGAPVFLIVGTSAEVGKTTAGLAVLRTLLENGHRAVTVLKATGTASIAEIMTYRDHGATTAFDFVDFGLPSTYPSKRPGMARVFDRALDTCLSQPADAVVIECGGDMLAANIPVFLKRLRRRRPRAKVVLVAADALGALGGTRMLRRTGLSVNLIAGPCTDTPALRQRTQALCRSPTVNLARSDG